MLQASALGEIQKGVIAKAIGIAFAQLCDLDDAQGEHPSSRVLVGIGREANPALRIKPPQRFTGVTRGQPHEKSRRSVEPRKPLTMKRSKGLVIVWFDDGVVTSAAAAMLR
jgi:hypothetical protein